LNAKLYQKKRNMARTMTPESPTINLLGTGTSVKGEIQSDGDFRIDGSLNGAIHCKGKLVIGATGLVEGEIICGNIDISGQVEGQVVVSELLSLKSTAKLKGDISTAKLSIEPGAVFTGTCKMDGSGLKQTDKAPNESKKTEKAL
jgi:cytoskeletal protein CcmA (bactofilin family)